MIDWVKKRQRILIFIFLYATLFVLSCWNWFYTMAICGDIPVNPSKEEFLIAESTVVIILIIFIYLTFKGHPFFNYSILVIPNSIWIVNFIQDNMYHYHKYSTILSTSMIIVLSTILLGNISLQIYRLNHKDKTDK